MYPCLMATLDKFEGSWTWARRRLLVLHNAPIEPYNIIAFQAKQIDV